MVLQPTHTIGSWAILVICRVRGTYSENKGSLVNECADRLTDNLPLTLSACGHDVWLGNTRGNTYSSGHTKYDINSEYHWSDIQQMVISSHYTIL